MRLLVVSQYFWPEDFRINELVAVLVRRGHEVTVLTGRPNYPDGIVFEAFARAPANFVSYEGATVMRVPMLARGRSRLRLLLNYFSFAASASIVGVIRLAGRRFDAIFVFEPSPVTVGIPAILLRAVRGWPIAFWVLDQWPESLAAVGVVRSPRLLAAVGALVRSIYSRCDVILSPSRLLIPRIAGYCQPNQRVEYFPNWIESAYDRSPPGPAPEVPESDAFTVLFAGNIGEAQDFPAILAAVERLREHDGIRWIVLGEGRMAAWVRSEIDRRDLRKQVLLLGRFPAERMPSFFLHADALLVSLRPDPIFAMTAPGKIQSYLAAGRPVLAMLDGEGAAMVERAKAGLASAAGNADALAANVLRLAAMSRTERARMGANGAAFAAREFNRETLVGRLEEWLGLIAAAKH